MTCAARRATTMKSPCGPLRVMRWLLVALVVLIAGCSDAPAAPPEAAPSSSTSSVAPVSQVVAVAGSAPVQWDGHTKEGMWVCSDASGTGQCPAGQQINPDGGFQTLVAFSGNLTFIDVNVTWQADPTQTGLVFAALGNTSSGFVPLGTVSGSSPLHLRIEAAALTAVAPHSQVLFMAWPQGKTPTSPSVFVDVTQQAFRAEGTLGTLDVRVP